MSERSAVLHALESVPPTPDSGAAERIETESGVVYRRARTLSGLDLDPDFEDTLGDTDEDKLHALYGHFTKALADLAARGIHTPDHRVEIVGDTITIEADEVDGERFVVNHDTYHGRPSMFTSPPSEEAAVVFTQKIDAMYDYLYTASETGAPAVRELGFSSNHVVKNGQLYFVDLDPKMFDPKDDLDALESELNYLGILENDLAAFG